MKSSSMRISMLAVILLAGLTFVSSCSYFQNRKIKKIRQMERALDNIPMSDTALASDLVKAYQKFAEKYPKDSLSPAFLVRAGTIMLNNGKTQQAIDQFRYIMATFPSSPHAPISHFMLAFTYDNYLRDFTTAETLYRGFMVKYPNHDLKDDAENALNYLGREPEDMIREFQPLNEEDSIRFGYK